MYQIHGFKDQFYRLNSASVKWVVGQIILVHDVSPEFRNFA